MSSLFQLLFVIFALFIYAEAQNFTGELKLKAVTVVFRHGDRAPDTNAAEHFPNDPHVNDDFFPQGVGGLTNTGKKREYELGRTIRTFYKSVLGNIYSPSAVIARSTDYERTKMSLQAALAGIYPPSKAQQWHPEILWQPMIVNYVPAQQDVLMNPEDCPQYLEELQRVKKLPEIQEKIEGFKDFVKGLEKYTGRSMSLPNDMFNLWHALRAESSMGLELPKWAAEIFPKGKLYNGTLLEYEVVSYNKKLKRLNGGMLLRNITESFQKVMDGTSRIKLTLLSGHETNVASLLSALGVYWLHIPEYGSAVFVELLKDDIDYYVKVQYYLGIPSVAKEMVIPGCRSPCPIGDFLALMKDVIPSDEEMLCVKKKPTSTIEQLNQIVSIAELIKQQLNHV